MSLLICYILIYITNDEKYKTPKKKKKKATIKVKPINITPRVPYIIPQSSKMQQLTKKIVTVFKSLGKKKNKTFLNLNAQRASAPTVITPTAFGKKRMKTKNKTKNKRKNKRKKKKKN
jgi:hypothetical protein